MLLQPGDLRALARPNQVGLNPTLVQRPEGWPHNAKAESVAKLLMFRDAYVQRHCIVPVDGFFEWRATKGARAKQPYAIAMKDGSPFGLAGLLESWRNPNTGEWERTFAIITVPSNVLVAQIHDRMPAILEPASYEPLSAGVLLSQSGGQEIATLI
jgi:putative SOS response-associated peptidase YedK